MKKERLDVLLTARGLAASREKAKAVIMSGCVYVDGQKEETHTPSSLSTEMRPPPMELACIFIRRPEAPVTS
ncbi:MAG: hypothetical protein HFI32_15180, partial [Lachnospiraceae bacterium]|nr:hypothetical protein [Lachnospiraceae bacterium]